MIKLFSTNKLIMLVWLPVAVLVVVPIVSAEPSSMEIVYQTGFEEGADINFDGWPDQWMRRRGIGFPQYLEIGIAVDPKPLPNSKQALRMELDGSGSTIYSHPLPISSMYSYSFEGYLKTEGLKNDVAYYSITFCDAERQHKEVHTSTRYRDANDWTRVHIGPINPTHPDMSLAIIGLHLVPTSRADLHGSAMFDNVQFSRLPRMTLATSHEFNLFFDASNVEVSCNISGIRRSGAHLLFELMDVSGRTLASHEVGLDQQDGERANAFVSSDTLDDVAISEAGGIDPPAGFVGSFSWKPPVPGNGFYQVRASMQSNGDYRLQRVASLAVMSRAETHSSGEFGWSLPQGDKILTVRKLLALLGQVGIGWVKFPAWFGDDDQKTADQLAWFADRLGSQGIEMIGLLDCPPLDVRRKMGNRKHLSVAEVFLEPDVWHSAMDLIMLRLSLKVQWWQLGADDDNSFIELPRLKEKTREIRSYLRQYGQRTHLGLPWRWIYEVEPRDSAPWDFLAMTTRPSFTSLELARYLEQGDASHAHYHVALKPLPVDQYDIQTRASDLVRRMITAKVGKADAIFLEDPFEPSNDVIKQDGTLGGLFLPWCTAARQLGGAKLLGSLQLPNRSPNYVFSRGDEVFMVAWNVTDATETLYLGEDIHQVDLWGREQIVDVVKEERGLKQRIAVNELPAFFEGLDPRIAHWRLNCSLEKKRLPSTFDVRQSTGILFRDSFQRGVSGRISLVMPDVWEVHGRKGDFKLAAGEQFTHGFNVLLHTDASSGPQAVRIDFDMKADRRYRFSVYRDIHIGMGDVEIKMKTWLDDRDRLIVEQQLTNKTKERISFNCLLFAPSRRRLRREVFQLGAGRITNTFVLPNGRELLGKTLWLRAEEVGGDRLLNYRVVAEP